MSVLLDIGGKVRQKPELQAGASHPTWRKPHFAMVHLAPGPASSLKAARLLPGTPSLFPRPGWIKLWEDSDLGGCDSNKWAMQGLWQAAHWVTDELVSRRAEPMYLANDKSAMLIESMWIAKKSKYRLYTKCPWWIDSSCCVLLWFQCIHSNYTCNSKFSLNLFLFTGTVKHCASKCLQMTKYSTLLQGRIWVHILN